MGSGAKNCGISTKLGDEAYNCFEEALLECEPAKMSLHQQDTGLISKIDYAVKGGTKESCTIYMRIDEISITEEVKAIAPGEQLNELQEILDKMSNKDMTCPGIDVTNATSLLSFSSADQMKEKCSGSLIEAMEEISQWSYEQGMTG